MPTGFLIPVKPLKFVARQGDHNNEKYSVLVRHAVQSPLELDLYGEVRYKASVYSLTAIVNLIKLRQVLVELHLDQ